MSSFSQAEKAATSLPHDDRSTAGSGVQHRSPNLRPRLRGNSRDTRKRLIPVSLSFPTKIGSRKVPRQSLAARPDATMIRNARRGIMSKFFRSGIIIRASDLGSMVDPKTAIISLTDAIEMQTDHLSDEEDSMPVRERTLENLFYICVQGDELPSYHFWRGKDDPDPINVHRPIDWHGMFHSNANAAKQHAAEVADEAQRHPTAGDPEREPSLLNFQEQLVRGEDSKGPDDQSYEASEVGGFYETMQKKGSELDSLDFYNDESNEEFILQSKYRAQNISQNC